MMSLAAWTRLRSKLFSRESLARMAYFYRVVPPSFSQRTLVSAFLLLLKRCADSLVHHLPDADFIIALDAQGRIVEQGTFADLRSQGKYIQSLDISEPDSDSDKESVSDEPKATETVKPITVKKEAEQKRSSDTATFKYYLASTKWFNLIVSAVYIVLQGVLIMLRCTFVVSHCIP